MERQKRFLHFFQWVSIYLVLFLAGCSFSYGQPGSSSSATVTLPGMQLWKQQYSSFLFGTNDTEEYAEDNIETQPAIQAALRSAGITLVRTFFFDKDSDQSIERRVRTIENIQASCLGVIADIAHASWVEHLVRMLGKRCLLYEFGNEADYNGMTIETYLKQWNTLIPLLRRINPDAKFIGPVTYNSVGKQDFMKKFLSGVNTTGVVPDAISFHYYPCYQVEESECLSRSTRYTQLTQQVRALVKSILHKDLPIGITEWNYDPSNPPAAYGENADFITKFTDNAIHAMAAGGVAFACQFDAASYAGYGRLDMFDVTNNQPRAQYTALKNLITQFRPDRKG